ncbi:MULTISPECIES: acetate/propionate family kinase [unclassified Moraxella]|uniref:acetate/propionate family kinase n=1 Tax=unclassified Moraxella TaxID=2685852 RepID=UPI003AF7D210
MPSNPIFNNPIVLTFNVGSATIKIAGYDSGRDSQIPALERKALFDVNINLKTKEAIWHAMPQRLANWQPKDDLTDTATSLFSELRQAFPERQIVCVHRVVHGGNSYHQAVIIDDTVMAKLVELSPICPLHQPPALSVVNALHALDESLIHIAAFDTAFHHGRPELWSQYALPKYLRDKGVRSYGFHGLSYQAIMRKLQTYEPEIADKRLIVAHLGSGCSITAIHHGKSQDSTFGFSGLDGVPMGTRVGHLDAGVILYMVEQGWTLDQMNQCLYKESGLLGLSEISNDVRDLLESNDEHAKFAIEFFVTHTAKQIASLMISMQGCDALIFTAGVGEHSSVIRQKIINNLNFLGFEIIDSLNNDGRNGKPIFRINNNKEKQILVILTDEQLELYLAFDEVNRLT